jgi:hypothetical protein
MTRPTFHDFKKKTKSRTTGRTGGMRKAPIRGH